MKPFAFSCVDYQKIKQDEYDSLTLDLGALNMDIRQAEQTVEELKQRFIDETERCNREAAAGFQKVRRIVDGRRIFPFLAEQRKLRQKELNSLYSRREVMKKKLVRLFNELEVLEDMRAAEYEDYKKEVATEEAKDIDSILSFNIHKEEA